MDLEVSCKKTNWPAWVCVHLRRGYRTCSIPCLGALWPWPHSYLMDMNKKKNAIFFSPSLHFIHQTRLQLVCIYTRMCVSLSRISKTKTRFPLMLPPVWQLKHLHWQWCFWGSITNSDQNSYLNVQQFSVLWDLYFLKEKCVYYNIY